ncbi:MAG TPA: J domain-containing protein [Spirochaetales bacterium]|nr:J domain-containing protein [Spirochaetales bacterium]
MADHYELLGVPRDAGTREIKSAFRLKAKRMHPDLARGAGGAGGDPAMRLLLDAYRTLLDPERRLAYDRSLRKRGAGRAGYPAFDYRNWLKERLEVPEYRAKLLVYDLLHDLEDEALELFESLDGLEDGRLERFFERSEAMDAEFCIAEEYEKRGRFVDAYRVYLSIFRKEREKPALGYFLDVVALRFRRLVLEGLRTVLEDEPYLDILSEAAEAVPDDHDAAQLLRRKAELLLRLGSRAGASEAIAEARGRYPRLAGLGALERKAASSLARSATA